MDVYQAAKSVGKTFKYTLDGRLDTWTGTIKDSGDCEDYALKVLSVRYGSFLKAVLALLSGKAKIWYVITDDGRGVGHAVGECDGVVFDNFSREAISQPLHKLRYGHRWVRPYPRHRIATKLLLAWPFWLLNKVLR